jgi:predicted GH43/DUF377 family glycosyl hydrolase
LRRISIREAVLFPASANEVRGIEDLRLVRFTDDDGTQGIYGTYTAYSGSGAFPTLFEIHGRDAMESRTLMGRLARNKGMALFPRKIRGRYAMSGRVDGENLYLLESSNVHVWNEGRLSMGPRYWWEFSIIGNCGSPSRPRRMAAADPGQHDAQYVGGAPRSGRPGARHRPPADR